MQADVFTAEGCRKLVDEAVAEFGQVDICSVGPGGGWHPAGLHALDAAAALENARAELGPLYHLLPRVLPEMYARSWGRVIALTLVPTYDSPAYAYNVAKAARAQAMLLAAPEAGRHGVTLNCLGPGPVEGIPTLEAAVEQCDHGPAWQERTALSPQDIAESVAFLCSEVGRFLTGTVLSFPE